MADAVLKRWRERCRAGVHPSGATVTSRQRLGVNAALQRTKRCLCAETAELSLRDYLFAVLGHLNGSVGKGRERFGVKLALRWLREEMEKEDG
jgi:hypothetical protein